MCTKHCCELGASHSFSEVWLGNLCSLSLPAWSLQGSGRFQLKLLMFPTAGEGGVQAARKEGCTETCCSCEGQQKLQLGDSWRCHMVVSVDWDPLQTPWKMLVSLYPQIKWHGLGFCEGEISLNTRDTSKKTLFAWGLQSWGTLSNALYFCRKHQPKAVTTAICVCMFARAKLENYRWSCEALMIRNPTSHASDVPQQPLRYSPWGT